MKVDEEALVIIIYSPLSSFKNFVDTMDVQTLLILPLNSDSTKCFENMDGKGNLAVVVAVNLRDSACNKVQGQGKVWQAER